MIEDEEFVFCFQPIEDRKLEWEKRSRINQRNDAYIERIEQKRSKPLV